MAENVWETFGLNRTYTTCYSQPQVKVLCHKITSLYPALYRGGFDRVWKCQVTPHSGYTAAQEMCEQWVIFCWPSLAITFGH